VKVIRRDDVRLPLEEEEDLVLRLARARAVVHVDHHLHYLVNIPSYETISTNQLLLSLLMGSSAVLLSSHQMFLS